MAAILAPILATLASKGLELIGSAVLAKGKAVVEDKLGVNIEESLQTEEGVLKLQQAQMDHEEELIKLAIQADTLNLEYYKQDVADVANARARDIALSATPHGNVRANWLVGFAMILIITIMGLITFKDISDEWVRSSLALVLGMFLNELKSIYTFEFGTTRRSREKSDVINSTKE